MKKMVHTAIVYATLALVSGVVFREVTKFANYTENTTLSIIHTHLFAMGMLVFLVLLSLENAFQLTEHKWYNLFYWHYNSGLAIAVIGFFVRGILQVYHIEITRGVDAAIAGVSGIGHILWAVGIFFMLLIIKKQALK